MSAGIIGKKVGMTRLFVGDGAAVAVTVIEAGPCPVVQVKRPETDRYTAVQLGFGTAKRPNRPTQGHFRAAGVEPTRVLHEFRIGDVSDLPLGRVVSVGDIFHVGDLVDVTGITKGRGFAGPVRRWSFRGGKKSHGGEKDHRRPGSIGASSFPSRVVKGTRMAGHYGHERVTVQNLQVMQADSERRLLVVRGAVPGPKNGLVFVRKAVKRTPSAGQRTQRTGA
jgi:large subunit ribosomal protein L3